MGFGEESAGGVSFGIGDDGEDEGVGGVGDVGFVGRLDCQKITEWPVGSGEGGGTDGTDDGCGGVGEGVDDGGCVEQARVGGAAGATCGEDEGDEEDGEG